MLKIQKPRKFRGLNNIEFTFNELGFCKPFFHFIVVNDFFFK